MCVETLRSVQTIHLLWPEVGHAYIFHPQHLWKGLSIRVTQNLRLICHLASHVLFPAFHWPRQSILALFRPVALLGFSEFACYDSLGIHTGRLGGGSDVQIRPLHHPFVSSQSKSHMFHVPQ